MKSRSKKLHLAFFPSFNTEFEIYRVIFFGSTTE